MMQGFLYPYLGKVNLWYAHWWQAPRYAQDFIQNFDMESALHNADATCCELKDNIPEVYEACRTFGLQPSTHEIVGRRVHLRAAPPAPRTPPKAPPSPRRRGFSDWRGSTQFVFLSHADEQSASATRATLSRVGAQLQSEGLNIVGYCVTRATVG